MTTYLAADCDATQLAGMGWPGVVTLGLILATVVAVIWLVTR